MAGSAWNHDTLSWHCPMSPSGCSDVWEQQSPVAEPAAAPAFTGAAGATAAADGHTGHAQQAARPPAMGPSDAQQGAYGISSSGGISSGGGVGGSGSGSSGGASGLYKCAALYPSAATSLKLGRNNLHLFR